jgi:hypothetical protein
MAMLLSPLQFEGEEGSSVCGRVVISRVWKPEAKKNLPGGAATKGKGKGKGKDGKGKKGQKSKTGAEADPNAGLKCELHLLGGTGRADVLYFEAWGTLAKNLSDRATLGTVIQVTKPIFVSKANEYSSSTLQYHIKMGPQTLVQQITTGSMVNLPQHYPFTRVDALQKVGDSSLVCLLGILKLQPGAKAQETRFGTGDPRPVSAYIM